MRPVRIDWPELAASLPQHPTVLWGGRRRSVQAGSPLDFARSAARRIAADEGRR